MDVAVLFDERIPLKIRNLAIQRIAFGKSLEPENDSQRELHTLALLLALEASDGLTLFEGEKSLAYSTGKNFDTDHIQFARGKFNSRP